MSRARKRGFAATGPDVRDPSLRGRTYTVPFEAVWRAAWDLADGRLRGWTVRESDDSDGVIRATSKSLTGAYHDINVSITLDANAQTRVDATAQARKPLSDFGRSRRRLRRFFKALDRTLARQPQRDRARR